MSITPPETWSYVRVVVECMKLDGIISKVVRVDGMYGRASRYLVLLIAVISPFEGVIMNDFR
ncbi:hypothetical protein D3C80_1758660 [compost metagenome]